MAIGLQRREFITLLSGAAATWPVSVRAQQPTMALVGLLAGQQLDDRRLDAVRQGLKEAGYIEGCNLAISIARPMVASTDYRHWPPRWWPIRWPSSLCSTQRLQSQPKLQLRPFRSYSRQAPIRSNSVLFPVSTDRAAMSRVCLFWSRRSQPNGWNYYASWSRARRCRSARQPGESNFRDPDQGRADCSALAWAAADSTRCE